MLRLLEITLFLAPIAAFAAWRVLSPASGPSNRTLAIAAGVLIVLATGLVIYSRREALPPGTRYVPAQFQDGRLIPSHAAPR